MIAFTRSALWISAAALFGTALTVSPAEPGRPPQQTPAQNPPAAQAPAGQRGARPRPDTAMDPDRARQLYVSTKPEDHAPGYDFKQDMDEKAATDRRYAEASRGVLDFQKISYRSSVGDMDIPAYLFQPLTEARRRRTRRDGLGARRRARRLGHHACSRSCGRRSSAATS